MTEKTEIGFIKWNGIGSHISYSQAIYPSLKAAISMGMESIQIFIGNPKSFETCTADPKDIKKTQELLKQYPTNMFLHARYVYNLAGSTKQIAWEGVEEQDEKTMKIVHNLEAELKIMSNFPVNGVIVHPGSNKNRKKGLRAIAKSINKINFPKNSKLLLENAAGQGTALATTFEEIKEIYDQVDEKKKEHIGVCVDTAHTFGYGLYDLTKCEQIEKLFEDFDRIIGIDKFKLLHLNDSKVPLGSKKDRHELIGQGFIWGENYNSLFLLLNKCHEKGIPVILETTPADIFTLSQLSSTLI